MALEMHKYSLFGFDLRRVVSEYREGWADTLCWPSFAWLSPDEPVRLIFPSGEEKIVQGLSSMVTSGPAHTSAVVVPDHMVLLRRLCVPSNLSRTEMLQAVELEVSTCSPFPKESVVWGWRIVERGADIIEVAIALASQEHVLVYLRNAVGDDLAQKVEVWADPISPIMIAGFGEGDRRRRMLARRRGLIAALTLVSMLIGVLALTPFMQLRQRVFDAQAQLAALESAAGPTVAARERLNRVNEQALLIGTQLKTYSNMPLLIEELTLALPDDAYLTRLDVEGRNVRISGASSNASALMGMLGVVPAFSDMRSPAAITRARDGRETFSIEFKYMEGEGK